MEAQKLLIDAQLEGIRKTAQETEAVIKINTVLIPGLNDKEIGAIAKAASKAGAVIHNIIPLIPQQKMADRSKPNCEELFSARMAAAAYLDVFSSLQAMQGGCSRNHGKKS